MGEFAELGKNPSLKIHFATMAQDRVCIFQHIIRLSKCMRDYLFHRNDATAFINSVLLDRCLEARCWHDTGSVVRQIHGIGPAYARILAMKEIKTFEALRRAQPEDLERWCNRGTPFGREILKTLDYIPIYRVSLLKTSQVMALCPELR